jgi:hypothetical protein
MSAADQRQPASPSAACAIAAQLIQAVALLRPQGTVQAIKWHRRLQVVLEHYSNLHKRIVFLRLPSPLTILGPTSGSFEAAP